jgi:FAD-linked sulfhydryl oxidase
MTGSLSKQIGPGVWWDFHDLASDPSKFEELRSLVNRIAAKFPCKDCRDHFQQLLKLRPLELVNPMGKERASPLGWSWTIHNEVNVSIGKPIFSWEECKQIYWENKVDCDSCSRKDTPVVNGFGPLAQLPSVQQKSTGFGPLAQLPSVQQKPIGFRR